MMKKKLRILAAALVLALMWSLCAAASADALFAFEKLAYEVNVGKSVKLTPILQGAEMPKGAKYVWFTSDKNIATVQNGTVSGKKGGMVTVTVQIQDAKKNVLYETSCEMQVNQPVKKITLEDVPKTVILTCMPQKMGYTDSLAYPEAYSFQLNPKVYPEDATNKKLQYSVSNPELFSVSSDGLVTAKFNTDGGTATVFIEATDGSGVKTTQQVRLQHFHVTETTIEMNERGAYRLYVPAYTTTIAATGAFPQIKMSGGGYRLENIQEGFFDDDIVPAKVTNQYASYFDVRPLKAGTHTLTIATDWYKQAEGYASYTITLKVKESAAYSEKTFPKLNYKEAMKDPFAKVNQQVLVKGKFMDSWRDERGRWCYWIATGSNEADQVIVCTPRYAKQIELVKGESVTVYGAFAMPLEEKSETGLTVYKLMIDAELFNLTCYNTKVYDVEMFDAEKANKVTKNKKK